MTNADKMKVRVFASAAAQHREAAARLPHAASAHIAKAEELEAKIATIKA